MSEPKLLNTKETAKHLGLSPRTLEKFRTSDEGNLGPAYIKLSSRCIRYAVNDIDSWIESRNRN